MTILEVALYLGLLPAALALYLPARRRPRWTALIVFAALSVG